MTTDKITNGDRVNADPSVPRVMRGGAFTDGRRWVDTDTRRSALANLAASEALPIDHPAQAVLLARANAYAALAIADRTA